MLASALGLQCLSKRLTLALRRPHRASKSSVEQPTSLHRRSVFATWKSSSTSCSLYCTLSPTLPPPPPSMPRSSADGGQQSLDGTDPADVTRSFSSFSLTLAPRNRLLALIHRASSEGVFYHLRRETLEQSRAFGDEITHLVHPSPGVAPTEQQLAASLLQSSTRHLHLHQPTSIHEAHPLWQSCTESKLDTQTAAADTPDGSRLSPEILAQYHLEAEAVEREVTRYQEMVKDVEAIGRGSEFTPSARLLVGWYKPLLAALVQKLSHEKVTFRDLLSSVAPEKLTLITLHVTVGSVLRSTDGATHKQIVSLIADNIQAQYNYEAIKAQDSQTFGSSSSSRGDPRILKGVLVQTASQANRVAGRVFSGSSNPFGKNKTKIGELLLNTLIEVAQFEFTPDPFLFSEESSLLSPDAPKIPPLRRVIPAFEVEFRKVAARSTHVPKFVRMSAPILQHISYEHVMQEAVHVRHYPMLVAPRPWVGPEDGGYYLYPASVIRYMSFDNQVLPLYDGRDHLQVMYEALNILGETPWRINQAVFEVVQEAWQSGGGIADLPSRQDHATPALPEQGRTAQWYNTINKIKVENQNLHSLRCALLLQLQVAEKFQGRVIYFPHNMDFRGRVYPIPPHLNHMGADICRGLLTFAHSLPLGPRGLYWLKIQLANLFGKDKLSFEERINFVDEHLAQITESATKPLVGQRWWLKAEDPWQCLAACFEFHNALNHPGGPENYLCSLPVHQDGTCNGLQHYAALGGDEQGARSVNLLPSDRPQDVYSDVAALVQARIAQDATSHVEIAALLRGKVDRRIIKQTVMTSVYGVTFIGAREQISNALKDRDVLNDEDRYRASVYLAKKTFESIGEMFAGAKLIMDWFATCASLVAHKGRLVKWVTPLGLPVVQPYKKENKKHVVKTAFQTLSLETEANASVNSSRQRSAFPPNFVHSLDSSHMLLTALACKRKNITFASVHDSYWCHAANVDRMNVELRTAFVELHRRPILKQLQEYFAKTNPDVQFPEVPTRGSFDLERVKQSPYFFN